VDCLVIQDLLVIQDRQVELDFKALKVTQAFLDSLVHLDRLQ